jgi:hypothetical protein
MKVKIKNEMDKIKLTLTHKELMFIYEALRSKSVFEIDENLNYNLFDAQEGSNRNLRNEFDDLREKFTEIKKGIHVF